jgi:hypothetical protein
MTRPLLLIIARCVVGVYVLSSAGLARGAANPADNAALDAPRVVATLDVTCTPDAKSKAAGAEPFGDTLELADDRVKSKALSAAGFPVALAIPKLVNGVMTVNVTFKKKGGTQTGPASATYFVRRKPDGSTSGSFTRTEGGKTLRYTIGATSARESAGDPQPPKPAATDDASAGLDPGVLRVNGGFVRLMSVATAMADAGVGADKAKVGEILKSAGADQNAMRTALLKGTLKPEQYVKQAEARLAKAHASLAQVLGSANTAKVEAAYAQPFAATYVHLNRMRAAAAEAAPPPEVAKRVDKAVYAALLELTTLARKREALTPEAVGKIKEAANAAVLAELGDDADKRKRFEQTFAGLEAYEPSKSP